MAMASTPCWLTVRRSVMKQTLKSPEWRLRSAPSAAT